MVVGLPKGHFKLEFQPRPAELPEVVEPKPPAPKRYW